MQVGRVQVDAREPDVVQPAVAKFEIVLSGEPLDAAARLGTASRAVKKKIKIPAVR